MEPSHVLLVDLPRMLREIVASTLSDEPDIELVGDVQGVEAARAALADPVDVVIVGRDDPGLAVELVRERPQLTVVAVADDGSKASLYQLRPQSVLLGELSPQRLVRLIREAARPWAFGPPRAEGGASVSS